MAVREMVIDGVRVRIPATTTDAEAREQIRKWRVERASTAIAAAERTSEQTTAGDVPANEGETDDSRP